MPGITRIPGEDKENETGISIHPPPSLKLAAFLLLAGLAMPAGPAVAEQCNASHIEVTKVFPTTAFVSENDQAGVIFRFGLTRCDNLGSSDTPREYQIPFCAEFFDTTPCDANATGCLSNNVAGARGVRGSGWPVAGAFKRCSWIIETQNFRNALVAPYNNGFRDDGENSLYVIMYNPTRHLRIPIRDDD